MLLADPHLPWHGLSRWYEAQLVVGERWIYGATFMGSPAIGIGFTADVAWASTNNGADTADVYRETLHPDRPDQYLYEGEWRDVESETITIAVKDAAPVTRQARRTHHGPIVREDARRRIAYTVRIAGLETTNLLELGPRYFNAASVQAFHRTNRDGDHFKWHRMAIDREGHIGYFFFAATHERDSSFNWRKPLDGTTRATEWGPRIPWNELPSLIDPPSGFLVNCNNSPYTVTTDDPLDPRDFPRHLAGEATVLGPSSRAHRATELITALSKLSLADMERISMDIKALGATQWRQEITAAWASHGPAMGAADPRLERALSILTGWNGLASVDSQALPILTAYRQVADRRAGSPPDPKAVLADLRRALDLLEERWGSIEVPWGRIHVHRRGDREWPLAGAGNEASALPFVTLYMTGAQRMTEGRFVADRGSSWMMLVRYREGEIEARTLLPWGNSDNPDSPHFADQAELFARRQYKKARLTRQEVEADAVSRMVLHRTGG
jgi:acyl-homoserine lactone acylase PvdQ